MSDKARAFLAGMPKAELHMHLDGALSPALMFEFARRNGVKLPYATLEDVERAYQFTDLQSFLDLLYQGASVLREERDYYDLTMSYLLHRKRENVVHKTVASGPSYPTTAGSRCLARRPNSSRRAPSLEPRPREPPPLPSRLDSHRHCRAALSGAWQTDSRNVAPSKGGRFERKGLVFRITQRPKRHRLRPIELGGSTLRLLREPIVIADADKRRPRHRGHVKCRTTNPRAKVQHAMAWFVATERDDPLFENLAGARSRQARSSALGVGMVPVLTHDRALRDERTGLVRAVSLPSVRPVLSSK
jgi:hypothetical protein